MTAKLVTRRSSKNNFSNTSFVRKDVLQIFQWLKFINFHHICFISLDVERKIRNVREEGAMGVMD